MTLRMSSVTQRMTTPAVERFCEALANTCNIGRACEAAGVTRTTACAFREENADFDALWTQAERIGVTALEDEAKRRAFEGVEEPVVYQGVFMRRYETRIDPATGKIEVDMWGDPKYHPVYDTSGRHLPQTIRKYSDSLVGLLLKAHDHDKYREHSKVEVDGNVNLASALIAARKRVGSK